MIKRVATSTHSYWNHFERKEPLVQTSWYFFESKFVQQLMSKGSPHGYKFHGKSRFTDDLCPINNDGEFSSSYKYICHKQLELTLEHPVEHTTFLDLDIITEDNIFAYKSFDKKGKFPFFISRTLYLLSNSPSSIFYGSIFSEFLWIAQCAQDWQILCPKHLNYITEWYHKVKVGQVFLRQIKKSIPKIPWKLCICMHMYMFACVYMYVYMYM